MYTFSQAYVPALRFEFFVSSLLVVTGTVKSDHRQRIWAPIFDERKSERKNIHRDSSHITDSTTRVPFPQEILPRMQIVLAVEFSQDQPWESAGKQSHGIYDTFDQTGSAPLLLMVLYLQHPLDSYTNHPFSHPCSPAIQEGFE